MSFRTNIINPKEGYEFSERRGESETMLERFQTQNLTNNDCFHFPATKDTPENSTVECKTRKLVSIGGYNRKFV